jgi:hypothetical protein
LSQHMLSRGHTDESVAFRYGYLSEDNIRLGKQGNTWDNGDTCDNAT